MDIICLPAENGTWQFFLEPYLPFSPAGPRQLNLDAFYPASQRAYQAARQAKEDFDARKIAAELNPGANFKALFSKIFTSGRNTLLYHPRYGSRFALGCVFVPIRLPAEQPSPLPVRMPCESCRACMAVCPTGAISEQGFAPERCLRALMKNNLLPDDLAKLSKNRLYGCDLCQRVCPMNQAASVPMPSELAEFLEIPTLIQRSLQGRKALEPLIPLLGRNYVRPLYFLCRAACAAGNSNDPGLLPAVAPLLDHPDPAVRHNAERAVRLLRGETL